MIPILTQAIKEQQEIIDSLKFQNERLEAKINELNSTDARQSADLEYIKQQLGIDLIGKK